ncbi:hypothetical protein EAF00_012031 [Botryotinia globosa]|nr:hypothetical protein EAF00_012031 [Botryotinia globosa]
MPPPPPTPPSPPFPHTLTVAQANERATRYKRKYNDTHSLLQKLQLTNNDQARKIQTLEAAIFQIQQSTQQQAHALTSASNILQETQSKLQETGDELKKSRRIFYYMFTLMQDDQLGDLSRLLGISRKETEGDLMLLSGRKPTLLARLLLLSCLYELISCSESLCSSFPANAPAHSSNSNSAITSNNSILKTKTKTTIDKLTTLGALTEAADLFNLTTQALIEIASDREIAVGEGTKDLLVRELMCEKLKNCEEYWDAITVNFGPESNVNVNGTEPELIAPGSSGNGNGNGIRVNKDRVQGYADELKIECLNGKEILERIIGGRRYLYTNTVGGRSSSGSSDSGFTAGGI